MNLLKKREATEENRNIYTLQPLPGWASESEKMRLWEDWMEGKVDCKLGYLEEAFGTQDFTSALYDAANVSMMNGFGQIDPVWKFPSKVVNRKDFKANYIVTAGGMGLLHKRGESESTSLQKPTDRKESYAIYPYDGAFGLSMEAQANDVTGVLMENFRTFGQAAVNTLNDFVWGTSGLLGGTGSGGTLSDGYVMFSASHTNANYATSTALNHANLNVALYTLRNQPDQSGTEFAGIRGKFLYVCPELESTGIQLVQSPTVMVLQQDTDDTDAARVTGTTNPLHNRLQVVVVDHLASTEWVVGADPNIFPCIEMGFLNGRTEPELYMLGPKSEAEFWTRTRYMKAMIVFGGRQCSWKTFYKGVG